MAADDLQRPSGARSVRVLAALSLLPRESAQPFVEDPADDEEFSRKGVISDKPGDGIDRRGNEFTVFLLTITAVIGSGVLSVGSALAMLGWVAGLILLLLFGGITWGMSILMAEVHVVDGVRHHTYRQLVHHLLGRNYTIGLAIIQQINVFLTAVAYTIAGASSLRKVAISVCEQHGTKDCFDTYWHWALIFGAVQVFLVQVPDLHSFTWLALAGTISSFGYSFIAIGLGFAHSDGGGDLKGIPSGTQDKAFGVLNALGAMAFCFGFFMVIVEIQDTLRPKPEAAGGAAAGTVGAPDASPTRHATAIGRLLSAAFGGGDSDGNGGLGGAGAAGTPSRPDPLGVVRPMRRSLAFSFPIMVTLYTLVATSGYLAFGNDLTGNIVTMFSSPHWVINLANALVVLHMLPAVGLYLAPVFQWEGLLAGLTGLTGRGEARAAASRALALDGPAPQRPETETSGANPSSTQPSDASETSAKGLERLDGEASGTSSTHDAAVHAASIPVTSAATASGAEADEPAPARPALPFWVFRLVFRTAVVFAVTIIALCLPFFGAFAGLVGAIGFWPTTVFLPTLCYVKVHKPTGLKLWALQANQVFCGLVSLGAVIGSIQSIVVESKDYTPFQRN